MWYKCSNLNVYFIKIIIFWGNLINKIFSLTSFWVCGFGVCINLQDSFKKQWLVIQKFKLMFFVTMQSVFVVYWLLGHWALYNIDSLCEVISHLSSKSHFDLQRGHCIKWALMLEIYILVLSLKCILHKRGNMNLHCKG